MNGNFTIDLDLSVSDNGVEQNAHIEFECDYDGEFVTINTVNTKIIT